MIAGGCEAAITPLSFAGFCSMKVSNLKRREVNRSAPVVSHYSPFESSLPVCTALYY